MKSLEKPNTHARAFYANDDGKIAAQVGLEIEGEPAVDIQQPKSLTKGMDYAIIHKAGKLQLVTAPFDIVNPFKDAVGGFHVGLDGRILDESIWDLNLRPACPDPRGMVRVGFAFWVDIYLTDVDGNSRAGSVIADGANPPTVPGIPAERFNFWVARDLLASKGKQLLSAAEFELAAEGVVENKSATSDPKKTGHIKGLRSTVGLEQATGCMWTWGRDILPYGWVRIMGGSWWSSVAGPRRLFSVYDGASDSFGSIGARGRCDHLILG